jgi:hypothetical protein
VSENLQKFIGIAVMALIVVVGVVATNNDDSDFDRTRNAAFVKLGDIKGVVEDDGAASEFIKLGDIYADVKDDDDRSTYVFDYDDEDSSGNESERVTFALELNDGKITLDVGPVNQVKLGGQEGEAANGENYNGLESERLNVVALGGNTVASVIVGDNHFRDVGDPASALKKLGENMGTLVAEDKSIGGRGPISKVVDDDSPTLAIQTDDGLTLGPLGGEGVFISIQDEVLIDVDTSAYTEVEWTYLQKTILEASKNLVAIAEQLTRIGSEHCWPCE